MAGQFASLRALDLADRLSLRNFLILWRHATGSSPHVENIASPSISLDGKAAEISASQSAAEPSQLFGQSPSDARG